jgi:dihydrofolate reductase
MNKPLLSLVVAMTDNRVIGRDNAMPWHLPADLAYFKKLTMGSPILMGRRTWASIGRPLPGRRNLVLSFQQNLKLEGAEVFNSLEQALSTCSGQVFVIGGADLFQHCLPLAQKLHITQIHATLQGDTFFPQVDLGGWRETERREHPRDEKNAYDLTFSTWVRNPQSLS